jgi:hypothetical protein
MDARPHRMGRAPQDSCAHEMMDVSFGGTWKTLDDDIISPFTWTLAFGGLGRHFLSP